MAKYIYSLPLLVLLAGLAHGQTMTEFGAAAGGSVVGAASGKAVSNGIDAIFGKLNDQTVQAAGKPDAKPKPDVKPVEKPVTPSAPLISTGGSNVGAISGGGGSSSHGTAKRVAKNTLPEDTVPPPPPLAREARPNESAPPVVVAMQSPFAPLTLVDALPARPIAPPPAMTPERFRQVSVGMSRADVLKLGDPASKVAMFEDGHMIETFSYRADGERFGRLRLEDGAVAKIEAN